MLKSPAMRVEVLAVTSFFLVFLFAVRPMRLIAPLTTYGQAPASFPLTPAMQELIKAETQKANDEIKLWIQFQHDWFHYKFLLVGAIMAIMVGFAKLTREKEPDKESCRSLHGRGQLFDFRGGVCHCARHRHASPEQHRCRLAIGDLDYQLRRAGPPASSCGEPSWYFITTAQ
jgi:hypothetical protein